MPALQVRDFPDDLYERLKACASLEHRSIAQQTVALVEEGLDARNASHYWDGTELHRLGRTSPVIDFDTEAARAARIKKRKELAAKIANSSWKGPRPTAEDIVQTIREGHEERDRRILEACGFFSDGLEEAMEA